ncbi:hypothetical protein [Qipengyuania soli]|uniref:Tetratricopeptide repeat protein n=1 Tax=Qipengyuania soli TaxID=2782568 RepID=A0A7S8F6I2_9SPHN|nr:hypothetical protein [Qipengyuania soli]QPD00044.1 hypothetical protein IRL76_05800 [Qipengyuania soli]
MIFSSLVRKTGSSSAFALAIALTAGLGVSAVALETPAYAAKEKKEKPAKSNYSKGFITAYKPVADQFNSAAPDYAAIKAAIPAVVAATETEDDRHAVGGLLVNLGQKTNDMALARQGLELMLGSGKVAPEQVGVYNFQAGQLAYQQKDYPAARRFLQAAIDAGYADNDPEIFVAESYFGENKTAEGLAYLTGVVDARRAAGKPINEAWIKRGLAMAYNNSLVSEAQKYAKLYVSEFPGEASWGDAVAIMLNTGGYQNPEILDLLRLGRRTSSLREGRTYLEYLDAADYRRLPAEVVTVIDEGIAKGKLRKDDAYVADTRRQAAERVAVDQKDMPSLMKSARASGATLNSVMAAGDALLSMGRGAEAEEFYTKALGQAGVNTPLVLTRLGIAQVDQGKYAEAQATFNKVEGARQAIASLWAVYAAQEAGSM